ncbi:hypothetical protein BJF90_40100 [Pseudonocardia sp. CNS-004]|nr:hypothetical protein BJF90_40100 [Pseudonocardia sp. CNS-004]
MGPHRSSQSRGQLVSHSSLPSSVSTRTQWLGTSTHGGGASRWLRSVIERPGFNNSQVRSAVIAPQGMTVTFFAVAIMILSPMRDDWDRPSHPGRHPSI